MTTELRSVAPQEQKGIIGVCILAAFADGQLGAAERGRVQSIGSGFASESPDVAVVYQQAMEGQLSLATAVNQLQTPSARMLAYEMAVCVCNADGAANEAEKRFLAELQLALQLDTTMKNYEQTAEALITPTPPMATPPIIHSNRDAELDQMILNAAILNGALEIMPQTLATMAIIPLQMRLVYRIGSAYGYELDRGHVKDFLATVGIGLTSQVLEGFTQQLIGGFARRLTGRFIGGLISQATSSAFAFASTYALGQVARKYYASGRTLTAAQLKEVYTNMLSNGRSLQERYAGDIQQQSRTVNVSQLLPLVRGA
ncbi:MAG TPA: DUF533 domain-containing protein [Verrucomicrobiae bacterium]|nr:DUF533 domain-containing protein [Verrucomicrobiae bacterium]